MRSEKSFLKIGYVAGVHGVRGLLRLKLNLDDDALLKGFSAFFDKKGAALPLEMKSRHKGFMLAAWTGVADRDAALALRGTEVFVRREDLPDLSEDDDLYYYADLIGLDAMDAEGNAIGKVRSLADFGAGDIIEITPKKGGETLMLPFTKKTVPEIDLEAGRITISMPEIIDAPKGEE